MCPVHQMIPQNPLRYRLPEQLAGAFITTRGSHPSLLQTEPAAGGPRRIFWCTEVLYVRGDLADPRNVAILWL